MKIFATNGRVGGTHQTRGMGEGPNGEEIPHFWLTMETQRCAVYCPKSDRKRCRKTTNDSSSIPLILPPAKRARRRAVSYINTLPTEKAARANRILSIAHTIWHVVIPTLHVKRFKVKKLVPCFGTATMLALGDALFPLRSLATRTALIMSRGQKLNYIHDACTVGADESIKFLLRRYMSTPGTRNKYHSLLLRAIRCAAAYGRDTIVCLILSRYDNWPDRALAERYNNDRTCGDVVIALANGHYNIAEMLHDRLCQYSIWKWLMVELQHSRRLKCDRDVLYAIACFGQTYLPENTEDEKSASWLISKEACAEENKAIWYLFMSCYRRHTEHNLCERTGRPMHMFRF
jgi:hypothetical protein